MFRLFLPIFLSLTASPAPAPALNPAVLLQFAFEFIDFFFKVGDASFQADDDFSSFNIVFILVVAS